LKRGDGHFPLTQVLELIRRVLLHESLDFNNFGYIIILTNEKRLEVFSAILLDF
jgi:hypothetical protein